MNNETLIIGRGQVGRGLHEVLDSVYVTHIIDIEPREINSEIGVMHICYPYGEDFVKSVKEYQREYQPDYTVIHSTVPVGTSKKCGAYHSPVRGLHPNLAKGIRTFEKFLGPPDDPLRDYFAKAGVSVVFAGKSEETEALKLWSTTQYAFFIVLEKEIYHYCRKYDLDFDLVYNEANWTYNEGYRELGRENVVRPILKQVDGPTGGHCLLPNAKLLGGDIAEFILKKNKTY